MVQSKRFELIARSFRIDDLRKAVIHELEVFQGKKQILRIKQDDVDEVFKIIRKHNTGRIQVFGTHCNPSGNPARIKQMASAVFYFVHRKEMICISCYLYLSRKSGKEGIKNLVHLGADNVLDKWRYLEIIYGTDRIQKIRDYLSNRQIREDLRKANECGIDISELKEKKVKSADFKNPCLLLVEIIDRGMATTKKFLYTTFGKFEYKGDALNAQKAFKQLTGARQVPYGKDAMKKIEALLIQASI